MCKMMSQRCTRVLLALVWLTLFDAESGFALSTRTINHENLVFLDYTPSGQLATDHEAVMNRSYGTSISADGRYVAFSSRSHSLLPGVPDPMGYYPRVYLRDLADATTTYIPLPPGAIWARGPKLSEDAGLLLFETNVGLFLHTRASGENRLLTTLANFYDISGNGRYVYFREKVGTSDGVYRYDTESGERLLISGYRNQIMGASREGDLASADGRSSYLYNALTGTTTDLARMYVNQSHLETFCADISADGKTVVFFSSSPNILPVPNPVLGSQMYLYDVESHALQRIDFTKADGTPLTFHPSYLFWYGDSLAISNGGRYVVTLAMVRTILYDRSLQEGFTFVTADGDGLQIAGASITPDGRFLAGYSYSSAGGHFVRIDLMSNPLAVSAGPDQNVEQGGVYGSNVTLHGTLSQGSCGGAQSFDWSWPDGAATGTDPTLFLPPGETTVTFNWSGCGSTASDTVEITVRDTLAPTLAATIFGTTGADGWYRSNLTVQLAAEDAGSGVKDIRCTLDAGAELVDAGSVTEVVLSGDGAHQLSCLATDSAGNRSAALPLSLAIDSQPPVVTARLFGTLYRESVYVSDVTLQLAATDGNSGVTALTTALNGSPGPSGVEAVQVTLSENGPFTVTYQATDGAGNQATGQASLVIDKSLLANALVETLESTIAALPSGDFGRTNPNDIAKLLGELAKLSASLDAIPQLPTPAQQLAEYRWLRQKFTDKLLPECRRMLSNPTSLAQVEGYIAATVSAIDLRIAALL